MRRACSAAVFAVVLCSPLAAQDFPGRDFWIGVGRFTSTVEAAVAAPPDLSGTYQVDGIGTPGDSTTAYRTTLTLKRKKTIETPQGGTITWYETRYNSHDPVDGVALHIGHRLYLAYGSKNILLSVGAPFVLTPEEEQIAAAGREVQRKVEKKNTNYDDKAWYFSKGAPWFSATKVGKEDWFHIPIDAPWSPDGFYTIWANARGSYGHEVLRELDTWAEGEYVLTSYNLKKGNEASQVDVGSMTITANGDNFQVEETYRFGPNEGSVDGTAHQVGDGTVVWVLGGGEGAGAGYYEFTGGKLSGPYWGWGAGGTGIETLTPSPEIAAKHAALFGGD